MSKASGNIIIPKGQVICGRSALRPFLDIETVKAASISRPRSGEDRMSAIRWLTQSSFVPGKLI